jgi:hypothetical protein
MGSTTCDGSGFETFMTATSISDDEETTRADNVLPFARRMVTDHAPGTTWALVSTVSGATKNPLPVVLPASTRTTACVARSATSSKEPGDGSGERGAGAGMSECAMAGGLSADAASGAGMAGTVPAPGVVAEAAAGVGGAVINRAGTAVSEVAGRLEYPYQNASATIATPSSQATGGILAVFPPLVCWSSGVSVRA